MIVYEYKADPASCVDQPHCGAAGRLLAAVPLLIFSYVAVGGRVSSSTCCPPDVFFDEVKL